MARVRHLHRATLVVFAAALAYSLAMSALSLIKLDTFHATFGDLGLENQILWLLTHGGFSAYSSSGFATVYAFNYQKPIALLLAPFYALAPTLPFLLVLQSFVLGFAAIPLFLFARRWIASDWKACFIALSYFVYFPVASANLFDFHYEAFYPLLFFLILLAWARRWRIWLIVLCLLCATVNQFALVTVVLFLLYEPLTRIAANSSLRVRTREYLGLLRGDTLREGTLIVLVGLLFVYAALNSLPLAGVGAAPPGTGPIGILFYDLNAKLLLFLLLFGALAFLPVFDRMAMVLLLPYAAFVFYSANSANWAAFGLAYPLFAVGPMYLGLVTVLARIDRLSFTTERPESEGAGDGSDGGTRRAWRSRARSGFSAPWAALALVVIVFAVVYFPFSPANAYVSGGYFSGNHDLNGITTTTPATDFLHRVLSLVPANAAVLTQNNIPQISGRMYYQVDTYYTPATPYNYILMDSDVIYFTDTRTMLPFVEPALANGSFGVVGEGLGALLVERGYTSPPELFAPVNTTFDASSLTPFGAATVNGSTIQGSGPSYSLWFGPYLTLYPGEYTVIYTLSSNVSNGAALPALRLDATYGAGSTLLASASLTTSSFARPNEPTRFVLTFHLSNIATQVELRGMSPTGAATLTLYQISLQQTSAS